MRYPQRQGFCSFNLLQQVVEGGVEDMIAPRHGLNCPGLHVCACDTCASASNIVVTTITIMKKDAIFIFSNLAAAIFFPFGTQEMMHQAMILPNNL